MGNLNIIERTMLCAHLKQINKQPANQPASHKDNQISSVTSFKRDQIPKYRFLPLDRYNSPLLPSSVALFDSVPSCFSFASFESVSFFTLHMFAYLDRIQQKKCNWYSYPTLFIACLISTDANGLNRIPMDLSLGLQFDKLLRSLYCKTNAN